MALKRGDRYILHAQGEVKDLLSIKPDASYKVQVHPTYSAFNFENMDARTARNKLSIEENTVDSISKSDFRIKDERIMLFFGFVREYKGLKHLINAVDILKRNYFTEEGTMPKLYVVGDFDGNKDEYIKRIDELKITDDIVIVDGYVPDKEIEKYLAIFYLDFQMRQLHLSVLSLVKLWGLII